MTARYSLAISSMRPSAMTSSSFSVASAERRALNLRIRAFNSGASPHVALAFLQEVEKLRQTCPAGTAGETGRSYSRYSASARHRDAPAAGARCSLNFSGTNWAAIPKTSQPRQPSGSAAVSWRPQARLPDASDIRPQLDEHERAQFPILLRVPRGSPASSSCTACSYSSFSIKPASFFNDGFNRLLLLVDRSFFPGELKQFLQVRHHAETPPWRLPKY